MAIAFIPVRGGSKSIPGKNIKDFCGKPLLFWTAQAMNNSQCISRVIIATDSRDIAQTALDFELSKLEIYHRDPENAQDTSSTESVMLEFLEKFDLPETEVFVLVQATNPFITPSDIDNANKLFDNEKADSLLSCVRTKRFYWNEDGTPINYDYIQRPRRQDFKGNLLENGAFYFSTVANIRKNNNRLGGKVLIYEMPEYTAFEIDEADDWLIMEKLFVRHGHLDFSGSSMDLKLFVSDVDGVLTDAGMYYSENGDELKKFNTHDGMAFQILRNLGVKTGIVTTENTKLVERRSKKLKIDYLYQGKGFNGKLDAITQICETEGITLSNVAYIGDDINCLEALRAVGLKACPHNAVDEVKSIPGIWRLSKNGGDGAVREFVERIVDLYFTNSKK